MLNTISNFIVTFFLLVWPVVFMFSPMMFAAPGSTNNISQILSVILILYYPAYIFLLYYVLGWSYFFGLSGKVLFFISSAVVTLGLLLFGFIPMLLNNMRGIKTSGYSVVNEKAYYSGEESVAVDTETFKPIEGTSYAVDKFRVYYSGKVLEGARPDSFAALIIVDTDYKSNYWSDGERVFFYDELVEGADTKHFVPVDAGRAKDGAFYYYGSKKIPADYQSLKWYKNTYYGFVSYDKNRLYINENPIPVDIDMSTFQTSDEYGDFVKDKSNVYLLMGLATKVIKGVDVKTFRRALFPEDHRSYYVDKNKAYYFSNRDPESSVNGPLEGVDVSRFVVTGYVEETHSDANDGKLYFMEGQLK